MWFLQRMLISWTAKKSNETKLQEAGTKRSLINRTHTHEATFFGYARRREILGHLVTTGMINRRTHRMIDKKP